MELLIAMAVGALVYGFAVKLILSNEPKSGTFSKIVWFLLWVFTLSFIFSSSSSANTSSAGSGYGGCDEDGCDDDYNFFETFENSDDSYDFMEDDDD